MKHTIGRWVVPMAAGLLLILGFALPQIPRPKARVVRISGVNHVARPFPQRVLVLTNGGVIEARPASP